MQSSSFKMFWFSVSVLVLFCRTEAAVKLAHNNEFTAVIIFGDSIVDTGNNNRLLSLVKSDFPPYGRDFIGGLATGRFSNGKVTSDFIVEELGIKESLPAYLDPNLRPEDLPTGVCFASSGSGYDPLTSKMESTISLENQFKMFKEYKEKLKDIAGEEKTNAILTKGFFGVVASSNDITNLYFDTHLRKLEYNISTYTDFLVNQVSTFVQDELYGLGARKIAVFGAPPLGCLPSTRTLAGEIFSREQCVEEYNEAAKLFNNKLSAEIHRLNRKLPHVKLVYMDIYSPMLHLVQDPNRYGFENVDRGCCGTGIIEGSFLCNPFSLTCTDASSYVFWDGYHPTERTYKIIVSDIMKKYINKFM